jgi:hypothetical protein
LGDEPKKSALRRVKLATSFPKRPSNSTPKFTPPMTKVFCSDAVKSGLGSPRMRRRRAIALTLPSALNEVSRAAMGVRAGPSTTLPCASRGYTRPRNTPRGCPSITAFRYSKVSVSVRWFSCSMRLRLRAKSSRLFQLKLRRWTLALLSESSTPRLDSSPTLRYWFAKPLVCARGTSSTRSDVRLS